MIYLHHYVVTNPADRQQRRCLLSAAFRCDSEWRAQQNDTTLSQHSAEYLLSELFSQFEKTGAASAVDVEVVGTR